MADAHKYDEEAQLQSTNAPPSDATVNHYDDVQRVHTSGANNEILHIGNQKVYKHELMAAFGGTLNPGLSKISVHKFANPSPLGLCAFALTTFVLSLVNVQARSVTNDAVVIGLAFFYGGFIQLCAGMWEMAIENTFGATALSSYGGFWLSFGAISTDAFGIVSSYGDDTSQLNNALGFYLIAWFIFTFILLLCTTRSTIAFFSLFLFLDITFLLLAIGHFLDKTPVIKAGGVFGIITAFIAWYNAFAGIATKENSWINVKPIYMPGAIRLKSD